MNPLNIDTSLVTFKAISTFCTALEEVFGEDSRELKLYTHLISKTTLSHDKAISKHIDAFRLFCTENRDALESKDVSKLVENKIIYSDKVFIDIACIFNTSDKDTSTVIWKHLLTIATFVDPTSKARQILNYTEDLSDSYLKNFYCCIIVFFIAWLFELFMPFFFLFFFLLFFYLNYYKYYEI